jgi:hypothetical protein
VRVIKYRIACYKGDIFDHYKGDMYATVSICIWTFEGSK